MSVAKLSMLLEVNSTSNFHHTMHLLLGKGVVAVLAGGALLAAARRAVALVPGVPPPLTRPIILQVPWCACVEHGAYFIRKNEEVWRIGGGIQILTRWALSVRMH